ncbi:type II toxin-antitoxin system VapC family toxin [Allorhizobium pseudoryzae]|uniref:type II toxin-antitoxin system VapC family toxin n=1 Tax=Allorhizobium pseudoryzae TaxID=379684 RepID=UPI003CFC84AA
MTTRTVDTNILVRLLVRDDSEQWAATARLVADHRIVVLPPVLLETAWVLRSRFQFAREQMVALFRQMASTQAFILVERESVLKALDAFSNGMDFADAMHLYLMNTGDTFITFDRDLVRFANTHLNSVSVELAR